MPARFMTRWGRPRCSRWQRGCSFGGLSMQACVRRRSYSRRPVHSRVRPRELLGRTKIRGRREEGCSLQHISCKVFATRVLVYCRRRRLRRRLRRDTMAWTHYWSRLGDLGPRKGWRICCSRNSSGSFMIILVTRRPLRAERTDKLVRTYLFKLESPSSIPSFAGFT